jgi:hypothetical protein
MPYHFYLVCFQRITKTDFPVLPRTTGGSVTLSFSIGSCELPRAFSPPLTRRLNLKRCERCRARMRATRLDPLTPLSLQPPTRYSPAARPLKPAPLPALVAGSG